MAWADAMPFKFLTYQLSTVGYWPTVALTGNGELGFVFDVFHTSMEQVATLTCNNAPGLTPGRTQGRRFESI